MNVELYFLFFILTSGMHNNAVVQVRASSASNELYTWDECQAAGDKARQQKPSMEFFCVPTGQTLRYKK
jgi:hypothetical protein